MLKDYYKILEIEPSAGLAEIKKAYRKLAMQYHPDKTNDNPNAAAQYADIKEAYETLIHPGKKNRYLQKRWFQQSIGKKTNYKTLTPENIFKQVLELEKYVSRMDHFRFDETSLRQHILDLISNDTIDKLRQYEDKTIHQQIVHHLIQTIKPLHYFNTGEILLQLRKIAANDAAALTEIENFQHYRLKRKKDERFRLLFILGLTTIITLLIYLASR